MENEDTLTAALKELANQVMSMVLSKLNKKEIQPVFRPRPVDKEIDQLKAQILYLQNKLNEHIDESKTGKNKDKL